MDCGFGNNCGFANDSIEKAYAMSPKKRDVRIIKRIKIFLEPSYDIFYLEITQSVFTRLFLKVIAKSDFLFTKKSLLL